MTGILHLVIVQFIEARACGLPNTTRCKYKVGDRVKSPFYLTYINTTGDVMSTQKSTAKDAVKTLSDFANAMCLERTEFAQEVMREHKTLQ